MGFLHCGHGLLAVPTRASNHRLVHATRPHFDSELDFLHSLGLLFLRRNELADIALAYYRPAFGFFLSAGEQDTHHRRLHDRGKSRCVLFDLQLV